MKAFEPLVVSTVVVSLNSEIYMNGLERSNRATIDVQTAGIRYRVDGGLPSATLGMVVNAGDIIRLESYNDIKLFRAIRSGAVDANLNIDYSDRPEV